MRSNSIVTMMGAAAFAWVASAPAYANDSGRVAARILVGDKVPQTYRSAFRQSGQRIQGAARSVGRMAGIAARTTGRALRYGPRVALIGLAGAGLATAAAYGTGIDPLSTMANGMVNAAHAAPSAIATSAKAAAPFAAGTAAVGAGATAAWIAAPVGAKAVSDSVRALAKSPAAAGMTVGAGAMAVNFALGGSPETAAVAAAMTSYPTAAAGVLIRGADKLAHNLPK